MSRSGHAPPTSYEYVGTELDLFSKAVNWKQYFGSRLREFVRGDVLEVGAGIGETTRHLCDGRQRSWLCLEPDVRLAQRLEATLAQASMVPRPTVRVGTLTDIDADACFDTVLYIDVLEHVEHDARELQLASERLSRGGAIIVLSPAFDVLFSEFDRAVGHFRRYTRRSLGSLFPPVLRQRRLTYLDSVGFVASLANRALLRQSMPSARQLAFWDGAMVPISRWTDPWFGRWFGRSVVAVYERP